MDIFLQDIRYAFRSLIRTPAFSVAAVLTLALGIGVNTSIFSVVNAVLLRPLPYREPSRLVSVWTASAANPDARNPTSMPDFKDWQRESTMFEGLGAFSFNRYELTGPEGTDQIRAVLGSPDLYSVLGPQPVAGRAPSASEERAAVAAISYRLWMRRYAGDRHAVGRTMLMDGQPYEIVGVMPPGFQFPTPDIDVWTTLLPIYQTSGNPLVGDWLNSRSLRGYRVVGRLKPGVPTAAAQTEMSGIAQRLAAAYPSDDAGATIHLGSLRDESVGGVQRGLWLVLGAAGFVLLLACANVAHLMLARTASRAREMAVRRALGATQGRVTRQVLTESVVLALVGGAVGVILATWGTALLLRLSPGDIPRMDTAGLDARVLAFAAGASLLTSVLFGLAPAVASWREGVQDTLRKSGRGLAGHRYSGRFRAVLMTAEVALALMLLVGSGLMLKSLVRLVDTDPGFRADDVVTFHVGLPLTRYPRPEQQIDVTSRVLERVRALPGVAGAGASTSMPPMFIQQRSGFSIEGQPVVDAGHTPEALFMPATPGYLGALGIPLTLGRDVSDADEAGAAPVAVVNRELVRRHFGSEDPLGHRIVINGVARTVVGVAGNATYDGIGAPASPQVYVPYAQSPFPGLYVVVRTTGDVHPLLAALPAAVRSVDPEVSPRGLLPMDDILADSLVRPKFQTWLLTAFGALALVLAAIGIYGVIAYSVAQRTAEIGVRLALGAPSGTVLRLIIRQGMTPVVVGLVIGVAGALALTRVLAGLLYHVRPTDAATFVEVTAVLGLVALVASYLPARRAVRGDPVEALRYE